MPNYQEKYLKYKQKYLNLTGGKYQNLIGGSKIQIKYDDKFLDANADQTKLITDFLIYEKSQDYDFQKLFFKNYANADGSNTRNMCFREKDGNIYLVSNNLNTRLVKLEVESVKIPDIIDGNIFFAESSIFKEFLINPMQVITQDMRMFKKDDLDYKLLYYSASRGTSLFIYLCTYLGTINVKIFYFNRQNFGGMGHTMDIDEIIRRWHEFIEKIRKNTLSGNIQNILDPRSLTKKELSFLLTL